MAGSSKWNRGFATVKTDKMYLDADEPEEVEYKKTTIANRIVLTTMIGTRVRCDGIIVTIHQLTTVLNRPCDKFR